MDELFRMAATPNASESRLRAEGTLQATDVADRARLSDTQLKALSEPTGYVFHPNMVEVQQVKESLEMLQQLLPPEKPKEDFKEIGAFQLSQVGVALWQAVVGVRMAMRDAMQNWLLLMNHAHRMQVARHAVSDEEKHIYRLTYKQFWRATLKWGEEGKEASQLQDWVKRMQKAYSDLCKHTLPHLAEAIKIENAPPRRATAENIQAGRAPGHAYFLLHGLTWGQNAPGGPQNA